MNLITFENICKSYSEKKLIENLSFGINDGEKIGLIGVNGTGKSTLLKIVAGAEEIDSGKITKANRVRIEYLPQSPDYDENATVLEQVFKAESKELNLLGRYEYLPQSPDYDENATVLEQVFKAESKELNLLGRYQDLLKKLEKEYSDKTNEELIKVQEQIDTMNLWDLENDAKAVLTKLGIDNFDQKVSELSSDKTNEELIKVQEQIDTMNLWDLENDAKAVLTKLGIDNFDQKVSELSGGQKKRISLASALITPCELLVLDEPTNHLDSDTIDWLEEYLNSRKGSLLMITHDRYFLDRVTNRILELDKGRLFSYEGNYTLFLEKKMERLQLESSMEDKRQNLIRNELKWVKRGARARTTKQKARLQRFDELVNREVIKEDEKIDISVNLIRNELKWVKRGARARTTKQKARLQRFDELVNREVIKEDEKIDISVASSRLGKKIIEIKNISKSFDGKKVIDDLEYTLARTDRIGIVGQNGLGKSTLINILNGKLQPDSGTIEIGETVKIGCFSQDDSHMDPSMKAIDYIKEESDYITTADGTKITASMMCERFLFNGTFSQDDSHMDPSMKAIDYIKEESDYITTADGTKITASMMCERFLFNGTLQHTMIEKLSGGERRRLHLLRVLMGAPNVLLLDEPTNDLDIETLSRLEDYLDEFDGVVITVSHDRYFLDRICNNGGERRRLHLLRVLMGAPNVLLLDEPTNDLDIETLSRLEDYLDDFDGVVITVSHDRYFLDRICNKIFAYEGNGRIFIFTGNYSDYTIFREIQGIEFEDDKPEKVVEPKKEKEKPKSDKKTKFSYFTGNYSDYTIFREIQGIEFEDDKPEKVVEPKKEKEKPKSDKKTKFSYKEQKEYDSIDSDIEQLEKKIAALEESTAVYATDFTKLQEIMNEKAELEKELEYKYERWEYLNELAESFQ